MSLHSWLTRSVNRSDGTPAFVAFPAYKPGFT